MDELRLALHGSFDGGSGSGGGGGGGSEGGGGEGGGQRGYHGGGVSEDEVSAIFQSIDFDGR